MGLSEALQIKQMPTLAETPILCHLQLQIVYFGLGEGLQDMSPKAAFRTHQREQDTPMGGLVASLSI